MTDTSKGTIAVTGASGFVGRHVVRALLGAGYRVRALVRNPAKLAGHDFTGVDIIEGSLADAGALVRLTRGARALVHVAGAIAARSRGEFLQANARGSYDVATAALANGVTRIVHVSSLAARNPDISDYAASKRAGEDAMVAAISGHSRVSLSIVRPPAVYGPGDKGTLPLMKQLVASHAFIPGDPAARFSLIHVEDLARALISLVEADHAGREIFELDDGKAGGYTWSELAAIAAHVNGHRVHTHFLPRPLIAALAAIVWSICRACSIAGLFNPGKVRELYHPDWVSDSTSLRILTDWRARIDFADGYARTVAWYRRNGWLRGPATAPVRPRRASRGEWAA